MSAALRRDVYQRVAMAQAAPRLARYTRRADMHQRRIGNIFEDAADWVAGAVETLASATADVAGWTGQAFVNLATDPIGTISAVSQDIIEIAAAVLDWAEGAFEAVTSALRDAVKVFATIAPFIQMGLSCIPGIGTVASAALGAAVALASGKPITDALVSAVKGAVPGGPIVADAAEAVLKIAVRGVQGDNLIDAAGEVALEEGRQLAEDELGPAGAIAFDTSVALARGKSLQDAALSTGIAVAAQYVPASDEAQAAFVMASDAIQGNPQNPASVAALASGIAPPEAIEAAQKAGVVIGDAQKVLDQSKQAYGLVFPPEGTDKALIRSLIRSRMLGASRIRFSENIFQKARTAVLGPGPMTSVQQASDQPYRSLYEAAGYTPVTTSASQISSSFYRRGRSLVDVTGAQLAPTDLAAEAIAPTAMPASPLSRGAKIGIAAAAATVLAYFAVQAAQRKKKT